MTRRPLIDADLAVTMPSRRLDMRGEVCPTPTEETMRVLEGMADGQVLEVESDYYPAKSTIPYLCDKRGYRHLLLDSDQPVWRIRIEKS
jgi:TusA-related sulfurtransferase